MAPVSAFSPALTGIVSGGVVAAPGSPSTAHRRTPGRASTNNPPSETVFLKNVT
jgi:hypothetical protein